MTALYNEIDKNAAAWLRQLIIAGHIAPGVVDERDIRDLEPEYVASFTQFHAFAGIGVWSHALRLAEWPDERPVWTGSCPCQPFSAAGKGGGFDDERHLWPAFHHLIAQCRPDVVLGEQVASKDGLGWLDLVHADLEGAGYAVGAVDTCAAGFGAPHIRQRLWWVGVAGKGVDDPTGARHVGPIGDAEGAARDEARVRVSGAGGEAGGLADAAVIGRDGRGPGEARFEPRSLERPHGLRLALRLAEGGIDPAHTIAGRSQDSGDAGVGGGLCGLADGARGGRREELPDAGRVFVGDRAQGLAARPVDGGCDHTMGLTHAAPSQPHPIPAPQPGPHSANRLDDHDSDGPRQEIGGVHLGCPQPDGSQLRPGPTNGIWGAADWLHCRDGRWRPVEPGTFPLAHGAAARVGRLRGYGNAIVAPQAQAFVEAVMEAVR